MSKANFKRFFCAFFAAVMAMMIFTLGASANTRMRPSYSREAVGTDDMSGIGSNNMDSGADSGNIVDSAPGTGEFGDDTSDTSSDATDTSDTSANTTNNTDTTRHDETGSLESSLDTVMDDAANAADDMTNGVGVWGVVIAVAIIAAIAILAVAFFSKKK